MSNMNKKSKFFLGFLLFLFIFFGFTKTPIVTGDGHEYSLTTKAFVNHFTPNIKIEDVNDRLSEIKLYPKENFNEDLLIKIKSSIELKESSVHGIFKTDSDYYFGYHYGFYPFLVSITEKILIFLDFNPLISFQLTNILIILLAVLMILKNEDNYPILKSSIFLTGGVLFYWQWTHPEVMAYSFLFLFTYFLLKKRYYFSIIFLALATTQIISFALLYLCIPILILITEKNTKEIIVLLKNYKNWIFGLISLSSILFYYSFYGKFSIISQDVSSINGINFLHFISYWFDLNQGVFIGAPWILILIIISVFNNKKINKELGISMFIGILICIPLLTNNNVNSGQDFFSRYGLYSISPLIAWSCLNINTLMSKKMIYLLIFIGISYFFYFHNKTSYVENKPWTKFLLNKFPEYYNPYPEIYIERLNKFEGIDKDIYLFFDDKEPNIVKKIIIKSTIDVKNKIKRFCQGDIIFINENFKTSVNTGWTYINTPLICDGFWISKPSILYKTDQLNNIDFSKKGYPFFVNSINGLSQNESWGTWLDGKYVNIQINGKFEKNVKLKLTMQAFQSLFNKMVIVRVNGIENKIIIDNLNPKEYELDLVFSKPTTLLTIEFLQPDAKSPKEMNINSDTRTLGLGLLKMEWVNF